MEKLKMHTANKADENFAKLAALFPNAVTEAIDENGDVVRAIDKDILMQEISTTVVEGRDERYQFTWPNKRDAILLANAPVSKTLRPVVANETTPTGADSTGAAYCSTGSVNFDTTENLYIEGDNLDVLKLLQETYLSKVKMIYIDPPYNTGNDFVYEDDFAQSTDEYMQNSGQYDAEGNRLFKNNDSNGRFHTDWLNMIYPRLKLAKDLLRDDGVIFISIDDNEAENLKKICNEVFGDENFVAQVIWQKRTSPDARRVISAGHEYVLIYAKNLDKNNPIIKLPLSDADKATYKNPDNDPRGAWVSSDFTAQGFRPNQMYEITTPAGVVYTPPKGSCWKNIEEVYQQQVSEGRFWYGKDGKGVPRRKTYLAEKDGKNLWTWWANSEVGHTQSATQALTKLLGGKLFDFSKPVELISRCLSISTLKEDIILDFFSGSATSAHAVMQLNAEDGGNRKFICVQLPEITEENSEAHKAKYKNICEIGKDRIRLAGAKIAAEVEEKNNNLQLGEEAKKMPDIGFRVMKLDSTNMKDVYYNPSDYDQQMLGQLTENIKEDRTAEDLLFQVMLELGVLLSSKIEQYEIAGKTIFDVADGYLVTCFDNGLTDELVTEIAKNQPYYFVTRDNAIDSDSVSIDFEQIFETYSKETIRKVL